MQLFKNIFRAQLCLTVLFTQSCTREFLDEKPRSSLIVPTTLQDMQALLDNYNVMNETPCLGEISADNYYLAYSDWQNKVVTERNSYTWAPDIYQGTVGIPDWNEPYQQVFYANVVLEGLDKIVVTTANRDDYNNIKGSALFARAYAFYNLAQIFAKVYDSSSAATDAGIPVRLSSGVDKTVERASVKATYEQVLEDLLQSKNLIGKTLPAIARNRPSKPAVLALLARVYLSMRAYSQAGLYADSSLQMYSSLTDYNTVSATATTPFTRQNTETLYQSQQIQSNAVLDALETTTIIDSSLYGSFNTNDLRKTIFFKLNSAGKPVIKRGYSGTIVAFSGLATDEMYLIRAEVAARAGRATDAMSDLNLLLKNRWKTGSFVPLVATNTAAALNLVLTERRKELVFRGLRWTDLRRLNLEGYQITLVRILNGTSYQLAPNSALYILPIPPDELSMSHIAQNPR